jgi:hypothetical protein
MEFRITWHTSQLQGQDNQSSSSKKEPQEIEAKKPKETI